VSHKPTAAMRRASPNEAACVWRELSEGRWLVLDRGDTSKGHHLVLLQRTAAPGPRPWHLLSARELAVVRLAASGCTNPQIARQLGVSVSTVAGHLRSARKKLGWPSRLHVIKEWIAGFSPRG
jgi:DNA-binding CsgD family transcriptional regulator